MSQTPQKPTLCLLGGTKITAWHVALMFKRLTGRVPSIEEMQVCQAKLDEAYERLAGLGGSKSDCPSE